jgi:hypothetical protein
LPGFFNGFDKLQLWNDLVTSGQHPDLNDHSSTIISSLIDIIQWQFWQVLLDFQKGGIPLEHPTYEWDSGADPRFQVRGGALKKIAPSGGRRENDLGISCEKSRFYAKKSYFFQF